MIELIKETAKKVINTERLTDIFVATVVSVNPIKIQVSQKLILSQDYLIFAEKVTDHYVEITSEPQSPDITNNEDYKRRIKYVFYNKLKVGDKVIIVRKAGGQKYYVLDRVGVI